MEKLIAGALQSPVRKHFTWLVTVAILCLLASSIFDVSDTSGLSNTWFVAIAVTWFVGFVCYTVINAALLDAIKSGTGYKPLSLPFFIVVSTLCALSSLVVEATGLRHMEMEHYSLYGNLTISICLISWLVYIISLIVFWIRLCRHFSGILAKIGTYGIAEMLFSFAYSISFEVSHESYDLSFWSLTYNITFIAWFICLTLYLMTVVNAMKSSSAGQYQEISLHDNPEFITNDERKTEYLYDPITHKQSPYNETPGCIKAVGYGMFGCLGAIIMVLILLFLFQLTLL